MCWWRLGDFVRIYQPDEADRNAPRGAIGASSFGPYRAGARPLVGRFLRGLSADAISIEPVAEEHTQRQLPAPSAPPTALILEP